MKCLLRITEKLLVSKHIFRPSGEFQFKMTANFNLGIRYKEDAEGIDQWQAVAIEVQNSV